MKPKRLRVSIGGFMGPFYSVKLVRGELQYRSFGEGCANWETHTISVSDEQWAMFRATLDSLGVWQWKRQYSNPAVSDGTQWEIDIAYADRRIRACGDNNYPARDGAESGDSEPTKLFARFCRAIQLLAGGREFQ